MIHVLYLHVFRKLVIIGVYVVDIILAGNNTEKINEVKIALSQEFQVKYLGELNFILGVQVIQRCKE